MANDRPASMSDSAKMTTPPPPPAEAHESADEKQQRPEDTEAASPTSDSKPDLERVETQRSISASLSPLHEFMLVVVILLQQFMTQAAVGQPIAIATIIGRSFGLSSPGDLAWIVASFSLTAGTFLLPGGRAGDVFGYKLMLLIGMAWFAVWSVICGLAVYSGYTLFIFARTLQGIGPAIMLPNSLAVLGATFPPGRKKAMYFGLFGAMAPNGSVVGSLSAAIFGQLSWWPWTFWSFGITMAIMGVVAAFVIPAPPSQIELLSSKDAAAGKNPLMAILSKLDAVGSVIGIAALVVFNFSWNQAAVAGWEQPYVYVCLIIGVLLVPVFFWYEMKVASHPLIPFAVFSSDVSFVLACEACGWACFGIWIFYIWQFNENIRHATPLQATAWVTPACISGAMAAVLTGLLLGRIRASVVMATAMLAFIVGSVLLATAPVRQIYWGNIFWAVVLTPFGMDMSFPAGTLIMSNNMPKEHQGIAGGLVTTVVNYSISLGLGFAGTVESHVNDGGANVLRGYRGAQYFGIGSAGLGFAVSLLYLLKDFRGRKA